MSEELEEFCVFKLDYFLYLMKDKTIEEFLKFDRCYKLADKYLLSMVFVYFVRAKLLLKEYTRTNFFVALYLAHDMEEDHTYPKFCLIDWAFGAPRSKVDVLKFLCLRNKMWAAMDFKARVSAKTCHRVMELETTFRCDLWKRERDPAHGGAVRDYEQRSYEKCRNCYFIGEDFYWSRVFVVLKKGVYYPALKKTQASENKE